ncbi:MAG: LCP family protein [Anaerolineales bacterium]|nr:LCP family protein [Anaerolineales bacterium]
MTKTQKSILVILSLIALILGYYALTSYLAFASKPLGPVLPVAQQTLPPLWTATPSMVTSAPTIVPTKTRMPLCGGPSAMTILAIGQDQRSNNYQYGLGDIVRVVRVDFVTPKVTVLEFPRDLWVEIPYISDNLNGLDHGKLNQAYLYGQPGDGFAYWDDPSQGPGLLSLTLTLNFGILADHYLAVNMRTFENVVNAIGGITINMPDIETAHNTGLPMGKNHLGGSEALKVARNREEGMFERVGNQNLVLCAMREKVLSPNTVTKIPELIESFRDNVQTDFTPEQLSQLACLGTKLPVENIAFASFPEELFTEIRIFEDPAYPKGLLIFDADFNILREYVTRFNAGTWPSLEASTSTETTEETSSSFCP